MRANFELRFPSRSSLPTANRFFVAMNGNSRDGWWSLQNSDVRIRIEDKVTAEWRVAIEPTALFLGRVGVENAYRYAQVVAAAILAEVLSERVRRIDLCVDLCDFDLDRIAPRAWLAPQRSTVAEQTIHGYLAGADGRRTGFAIGKSAVRLRVYDKTEELKRPENDGPKRDEEHERWRAAGWSGDVDADRVTRVEFQVRGDALDEMGVREPDRLLARLDEIWGCCTTKWVRLIEPGTATRRERCRTDPRW